MIQKEDKNGKKLLYLDVSLTEFFRYGINVLRDNVLIHNYPGPCYADLSNYKEKGHVYVLTGNTNKELFEKRKDQIFTFWKALSNPSILEYVETDVEGRRKKNSLMLASQFNVNDNLKRGCIMLVTIMYRAPIEFPENMEKFFSFYEKFGGDIITAYYVFMIIDRSLFDRGNHVIPDHYNSSSPKYSTTEHFQEVIANTNKSTGSGTDGFFRYALIDESLEIYNRAAEVLKVSIPAGFLKKSNDVLKSVSIFDDEDEDQF